MMKFTSKSDAMICFWASLLMLCIKVLNLILYIWVFNTIIEVISIEIPIKITLCYYFKAFDQKIMVLIYRSIFLVHFTILASTWCRPLDVINVSNWWICSLTLNLLTKMKGFQIYLYVYKTPNFKATYKILVHVDHLSIHIDNPSWEVFKSILYMNTSNIRVWV